MEPKICRKKLERKIETDPSVRAIAASGYSNDPVVSDYVKFGFKGAIVKPSDTEKLKESIEEAIKV